jgi:hypothetical protein
LSKDHYNFKKEKRETKWKGNKLTVFCLDGSWRLAFIPEKLKTVDASMALSFGVWKSVITSAFKDLVLSALKVFNSFVFKPGVIESKGW